MTACEDYYARLGVLPSIDPAALTAAYRALMKIYHPDVYRGPRSLGERITRELNEAYHVLGDPQRRAAYDRTRVVRATATSTGASRPRRPRKTSSGIRQPRPLDAHARREWTHIAQHHPSIERLRAELAQLSAPLAASFQLTLLERRSIAHARPLASGLRRRFLERHFGTNPTVHRFVVAALKAKRRDVAHEVNRAVLRHGSPKPSSEYRFLRRIRLTTLWFGAFEPATRPEHASLFAPLVAHLAQLRSAANLLLWRVLSA